MTEHRSTTQGDGATASEADAYRAAEAILWEMSRNAASSLDVLAQLGGAPDGRCDTDADIPSVVARNAGVKYRTLLEQIPAVTFMAALDGSSNELYVSPQIETMLGFSQKEWLDDPVLWYTQLHPDDRLRWHEEFALTCATGQPFSAEYRFISRAGKVVWVHGDAKVVRDEDGNPLFLHGIAFDITQHKVAQETLLKSREILERRVRERTAELSDANRVLQAEIVERQRAEVALRQSESRTRAIVESAHDAIVVMDERGRITEFNPAAEQMFGQARADVRGREVADVIVPPALRDPHRRALARYFGTRQGHLFGKRIELAGLHADGSEFPIELTLAQLLQEGAPAVMAHIRDITERKRAEDALRRSEEQMRSVVDHAVDGIITIDEQGTVQTLNPAAERIFGYRAGDVVGLNVNVLMPEPYHREHDGYLANYVHTGKAKIIGIGREVVGRRKDRSTFPMDLGVNEFRLGDRRFFTGIVRDITERKAAEERIRQQATLLDEATDAILVHDLDGRISFWNRSAERLYGWTAAEAVGQDVNAFLPFAPAPEVEVARRSLAQRGEWSGELGQTAEDGREIVVASRWTMVHDDLGRPKSVLVINTDITAQKKLHTLLYRAQRMESIGTLAGGIAHDLNNLLTPLLMSVQLLKMPLSEVQRSTILDTLQANVERGADLVKQVLMFARGVEGERVPVRTGTLVEDIRKMLVSTVPKTIEITASYPDDLWTVLGDATKIHQVLMNLCVNACDAMPDGGTLTIAAENAVLIEADVQAHRDSLPGDYVLITVTDTGNGIPPEALDKIFDPFFTTKEIGKGTGLGLSTVAGIVKGHRGFVSVYTEPHRGTRFSVYLPAAPAPAEGRGQGRPSPTPGCGKLVLVIDDDASVQETSRAVLEANGYQVLTTPDGYQALSLILEHRAELKAVVTDMTMPKFDGPATILAIQQINPDLPIIAISGLPPAKEVSAVLSSVRAFLSKPFTADALLTSLGRALGPT